ncbi:MAG: hypothetical protein ACI8PT_000108 [Gammaproteobacteria bacterium]|jgi:hypothetical protein
MNDERRYAGVSMRKLGAWVLALMVITTAPAYARMYQWVNPRTGLSQMSGTPPAWYRASPAGPRILVYDNGTLLDDTALPVTEVRSQALRDAAFDELRRLKEFSALQRLEETARQEADRAERERRPKRERVRVNEAPSNTVDAEPALGSLEQFGADTIERLKSIISEFDKLGGDPEGGGAQGGSN